jgi:phospholipase A1/A2
LNRKLHTFRRQSNLNLNAMHSSFATVLIAITSISTWANAQNHSINPPISSAARTNADRSWQQCLTLSGADSARLACFDQWAAQQAAFERPPEPSTQVATGAHPPVVALAAHDCNHTGYSQASRFWELEAGTDCGTFNIRGFRPISLSWIGSDSVNTQPTSPSVNNSATTSQAFSNAETRIQLSVRTKVAQGLLTQGQDELRDSLWFSYSQQSYWQLFNSALSRPFRSTDHEPEITYIYPSKATLPLGWQLRYSGLSLNHQSNGQSLPLSRSWNRAILIAGLEKDNKFILQAQLWRRLNEKPDIDDNPDIMDKVGRAEVSGFWSVNKENSLGMTVRHTLRANANGSVRMDWYRTLGDGGQPGGTSGLRLHTRLFTGFGDSLVDYNRRRTVLSIGLSLVDW